MKDLYDLLFDEVDDTPAGFLLEVPRGSSLDVGILHQGRERDERKRCTLEFWFHLPPADQVEEDLVLARRAVTKTGEDLSKLCVASDSDNFIWELVVLPSGELEFRTHAGTTLKSTDGDEDFGGGMSDMMGDFGGDDESDQGPTNAAIASFERPDGGGGWNHVCITFSSKFQETVSECAVTMLMKGTRVASTVAKMVPPGLSKDSGISEIDEAMEKTVLLFGVNPIDGLAFTELRVWACERNEDDVKRELYEYLPAAEMKKKIKIIIKRAETDQSGGLKAPPGKFPPPPGKSKGGLLRPPPSGKRGEDKPKGLLPPPRSRRAAEEKTEPAESLDFGGFPAFDEADTKPASKTAAFTGFPSSTFGSGPAGGGPGGASGGARATAAGRDGPGTNAFGNDTSLFPVLPPPKSGGGKQPTTAGPASRLAPPNGPHALGGPRGQPGGLGGPSSALPLSRQVRSSAAAALVRGPPATRHFGGNRGGLTRALSADRRENGRFGVGNIAICGAEKTVVYKYDRSPPGKTYPIGASGAIISDEMDNDGSEYLCCFLAKDKRMVVFELSTKTVVVELQMTTKLNYWRYLPPQAHGHTLVFMLITPVGGFHWMPLDESPRPRQVWKRGPDLQGKKIVAYEEGGSNGMSGPDARSTVALLLVSTASSGTPLEAFLMPVCGDSRSLLVSSDLLGGALFRPYEMQPQEAFLPLLVTADSMNEKDIIIEVQPLVTSLATGSLGVGDVIEARVIDQNEVRKVDLTPPTLAMGTWPEVFVCCYENIVVTTIRRKGLLTAYEFTDDQTLSLIHTETFPHYVVDAAVRSGMNDGEAEVVLLLSDSANQRDGRVVSIIIKGTGFL